MNGLTPKRVGVLLIVAAVIVGSIPAVTVEGEAAAGVQNPTDNIPDDQVFEGSNDGQIEVWNRAAYPMRTDDTGAPTQVNYPGTFQGQRLADGEQFDSSNNGGDSKDLNPASFNGQRNPAGVHNPGSIFISFDGDRGGTNDLATQDNVTFLAANVTGQGGEGVPADYSSAVDLLSDVEKVNANATFRKINANASLDADGETSFSANFGPGYHVIFASVRQDGSGGFQVDSEGNISVDGDVVIVGVEMVAVQKDEASVSTNPGNPTPGDTINFNVNTAPVFGEQADVTHTVALYEKGTFEDSRVDIVTNESKFGPNFNLSNGSQVEHSIENSTGVADVEDGIEINGVDLSDGRVARSVGLGAIIDQIAEDFTTNDPQTDPILEGGSSNTETEEIFASLTAVSERGPVTRVSVETFSNFSTGEYQYIVYSQLDDDATQFSTASGTITIESEPGRRGNGGNRRGGPVGDIVERGPDEIEAPGRTIAATKQPIEGGESASATIVSLQAGDNVRIQTDTSTDDGSASVESVDLDFAKEISNANVGITTTRTAPAGAPDPDSGQTGDTTGYVEATVSGEGVTESDVASSAFTFRVSQQRLDRTGTSPENVRLYRIEDGEPTALETEHLGNNRFRSVAPGFSVFVIGTTPAEFTFTSGELDRTSVAVGETFTATVQVQNDGGASGETTLTLEADGDTLTSETITLDSGESAEVDVSASIDEAGSYDITVNGNAVGTLEVTDEGATTPEGEQTPEGPDEEPGEGTPATGATPTEAPGAFGPGFGVIAALLALLGASLIALQRRQ